MPNNGKGRGLPALAAGASDDEAEVIGWSGMLHDVGKLRVPDGVLLKPGRLDPEEWETIQKHTTWGEELLTGGEHFALARTIARSHHENWDGTGYPDRMRAEGIPFEARLVRIVDVYDALRSERPYKAAWSEDEIIEELRRLRGVHFDPEPAAAQREQGDIPRRRGVGMLSQCTATVALIQARPWRYLFRDPIRRRLCAPVGLAMRGDDRSDRLHRMVERPAL